MEAFATYVTRIHAARFQALEGHWHHHKPLCQNGVVSLDSDCWNSDCVRAVERLGLVALRHPQTTHNFDAALGPLQVQGNALDGKWFLTLDSDEYLHPRDFEKIALAVGECERSGYTWLRGWLCDRVARGGEIVPLPEDCSYGNLSRVFCVATDATKHIQGGSNVKCFVSQKPYLGKLHSGVGAVHPNWFRLDHFKWHGKISEQLEHRAEYFSSLGMSWAHQYKRMADHINENGRIMAETCLSKKWEDIHGWFDYWDIYSEAVDLMSLLNRPCAMVEVGVWHGRSAFYLAMLSRAKGVDSTLYLIDKFADAGYIGQKPKEYGHSASSFINVPVEHFEDYGLNDDVKYLQVDSVRGSRVFDDASCDFVFIDTDHTYDSVKREVLAWLPKMKSGSLLAGHDYDWAQVKRAVDECFGPDVCTNHNGKSWKIYVP